MDKKFKQEDFPKIYVCDDCAEFWIYVHHCPETGLSITWDDEEKKQMGFRLYKKQLENYFGLFK